MVVRQFTGPQWIAFTYMLNRGFNQYIPQNQIYCARHTMLRTVGPVWFIRLLEFRDLACRSWAQHCFDLQLVREGERAPWPTWLQYGW